MSKSTLSEKQFQRSRSGYGAAASLVGFHPFDSRRSAPGFPDLTMVRDGKLIFAELKVGKNNHPTEDQRRWLSGLSRCLPQVYVWRPSDWPEIKEVLR